MVDSYPSRRRFLKLGVTGAIVAVVAGVGSFLALQPQPSMPMATPRPPPPPIATPSPAPVAPRPSPAPTPTPTISLREKLIADAKKEGTVTLYSSFDPDALQAQTIGFTKKYPEIKVEIVRSGVEIVQRYSTERRANRDIMDVFEGSMPYLFPALELDMVDKYISPEATVFPADRKDPNGLWTLVIFTVQCIAYNTNLVKGEDIPKSYWDLLKPKWKGQITIYDPRSQPLVLLATKEKIIGPARYLEFLKGLNAQEPKVIRGSGGSVSILKTGEAAIGLWLYTGGPITEAIEAGAPVDFVRRAGTLIGHGSPVWLNKFAPHPNAGRLLYDHIISYEGQQMLGDRGTYIMTRPGVPSKVGLGRGTGEPVTADMVTTITTFTEAQLEEYAKEWSSIFRV